nr:MAG TPA: hypothetical protein [Caudoviricetes sp.]
MVCTSLRSFKASVRICSRLTIALCYGDFCPFAARCARKSKFPAAAVRA